MFGSSSWVLLYCPCRSTASTTGSAGFRWLIELLNPDPTTDTQQYQQFRGLDGLEARETARTKLGDRMVSTDSWSPRRPAHEDARERHFGAVAFETSKSNPGASHGTCPQSECRWGGLGVGVGSGCCSGTSRNRPSGDLCRGFSWCGHGRSHRIRIRPRESVPGLRTLASATAPAGCCGSDGGPRLA